MFPSRVPWSQCHGKPTITTAERHGKLGMYWRYPTLISLTLSTLSSFQSIMATAPERVIALCSTGWSFTAIHAEANQPKPVQKATPRASNPKKIHK